MSNQTQLPELPDRVSPATAWHLKRAGYPQPEIAFGQWWVKQNGERVMVWNTDNDKIVVLYLESANTVVFFSEAFERMAYMPTAPDILRELGQSAVLLFDQDEFLPGYLASGGNFLGFIQPHDPNSAEACAEAWKAKQNKP